VLAETGVDVFVSPLIAAGMMLLLAGLILLVLSGRRLRNPLG